MTDTSFLDSEYNSDMELQTSETNSETDTSSDPELEHHSDQDTQEHEDSVQEGAEPWVDDALENFEPSDKNKPYAEGKYNDHQVERILHFCLKYYQAPVYRRAFLRQLFGWDPNWEVPPTQIAMNFRYAGESIAAYGVFANITRMFTSKDQDYLEVMKVASDITEMEVDTIRDLFRKISVFTGKTVIYRRDMNTHKVLEKISEVLSDVDNESVGTLEWVDEMINIWPGMNV